jgi:hypothetical protein
LAPSIRSTKCGNSSVGRARPCQGRGREFESRFPLQIQHHLLDTGFIVMVTEQVLCNRPEGSLEWSAWMNDRTDGSKKLKWLGGRVAMPRTATPFTPVRFRPQPPFLLPVTPGTTDRTSPHQTKPICDWRLGKLVDTQGVKNQWHRPDYLKSPGGEIGRRKGLKIPRPKGHTGSIPVPGTTLIKFLTATYPGHCLNSYISGRIV